MMYRFCNIRKNITKYDVTFASKEGSNPNSPRGNNSLKISLISVDYK